MERMHIQMKEHLGSDVNYLRQLNLQLVDKQMKSECVCACMRACVRVCMWIVCAPVQRVGGWVWLLFFDLIYLAEKATEILKEVKAAQNAFRKQKEVIRMESEVEGRGGRMGGREGWRGRERE